MTIVISDFYKDDIKALAKANLKDELEYHIFVHGCKPTKVFILHQIEAISDKYKPTKNTMILSI
ncbi:hypothetical protein LG329_19460 (plasmid) [Virgibacillus necropolis]|uniref:hypothetical protein n=1 Tax=Virgibacillus necropolis TaxID=163877 RepID=UPI00384A6573